AAVGEQRVVVLQREQQLEGAEVAVGRDLGSAAVLQPHGLQRTARLVEAKAQRVRGPGATRGGAHLAKASAQLAAQLAGRADGIGVLGVDHRAEQPGADRDEAVRALALERTFERRGRGVGVIEREGEDGYLLAYAEWPKPRLQVLGIEMAGERLGQHVAGHVAL